jgi:hypothetical protein
MENEDPVGQYLIRRGEQYAVYTFWKADALRERMITAVFSSVKEAREAQAALKDLWYVKYGDTV